MFSLSDVRYLPEAPAHAPAVEAIADEAFGPGRFVRAAERVREMALPDPDLCFVALVGGEVVGSVRQTPILIGDRPALMLGPLAVRPSFKNRGIGKALMRMTARAAAEKGEAVIVLVGDPPYYAPLGYKPLPRGSIVLPGPADPARVLALPLFDGAVDGLGGAVRPRR